MSVNHRTVLKLVAALVLTVAVVAFARNRLTVLSRSGEDGATVWFYDQSEKRLYEVSREIVPPDKGIGGATGDGVRAIVVASRSEQGDPHNRRIAYLETCSPELKALMEKVRAAHAAGLPLKEHVPERNSDFFQTNLLVRAVSETEWHPSGSAEGRRIMAEWRSWRDGGGQPLIVCSP